MAFLEEGNNYLQMESSKNNHVCIPGKIHDDLFTVCKKCNITLHPLHPLVTYHRLNNNKNMKNLDDIQISFQEIKQKQKSNRIYMQNPIHHSFRQDCVQYMRTISAQLSYQKATFCSAVAIMDLTLSEYEFSQNKILLICVVSIIIAAKVHEPNNKIPYISNIVKKSKGQWTEEQYMNYEQMIFVKILNFNANIITSYQFTQEFLNLGVLSNKEIGHHIIGVENSQQIIEFFYDLVELLTDVTLDMYQLYKYDASTVAAAVITLARKLLGYKQYWNQHLQNLTSEKEEEIKKCIQKITYQLFLIKNNEFQIFQQCQSSETSTQQQSLILNFNLKKRFIMLEKRHKFLKQMILRFVEQEQYKELSSYSELLSCSLEQLFILVRKLNEQDQTRSSIDNLLCESNLLHSEINDEDNSLLEIIFSKLLF